MENNRTESIKGDEYAFGDGAFVFSEWPTPFQDDVVEIVGLAYSANEELTVNLKLNSRAFSVIFADVNCFRVLDEHGLLEYWAKTEELGRRPARTTFRVRNSAWAKESILSFQAAHGWSYVMATDWDCVEVVTATEPKIIEEMVTSG